MTAPRLYPLLPSWYRSQDARTGDGRPCIQAWVARVEATFDALHAAAGEAYDDWFVETCAPEVLPVIGWMVGLELDGPPLPGDRRLVANAMKRWRRKGSAWALRDALEAACGWPVEVREFENDLLATQATSHMRAPSRPAGRTTPALGTSAGAGPNLRRIAVRVRRGFGVVVEDADPTALGHGWYAFDAGGYSGGLSARAPFARVRVDGDDVPLASPDAELRRAWQATPRQTPADQRAVLDAARGRFWLPESLGRNVRVDFTCWRPGPIGAGLPDAALEPPPRAWRALVSRDFSDAELGPGCFRSVRDALAAWPAGEHADVRILDSGRYERVVAPPRPGQTLTLHAHPGELPCVAGVVCATGGLRLGGVLVAGDVQVRGAAEIHASSVCGGVSMAGGTIRRSVVGPVDVTAPAELQVVDSVVGERAFEPAGAREREHEARARASVSGRHADGISLRAETTTFLGSVAVGEVTWARDCLFCKPVSVARPHLGRFEHSAHPRGSRVAPDAERCAFAADGAPRFASTEPGSPGYACLLGPGALLESASDGGEPGAFHSLHVRARRQRLDRMLERFVPVGFEPSVDIVLEGTDG